MYKDIPPQYIVTAALPYANGPKHVGHLAGAYLPADVYARYLRLKGEDVVFVCGSDENGTAIPNQAVKENTTPQKIIDKYHTLVRDCLYKLGMSFDVYHRTSDPLHHKTAQEFFSAMVKKNILEQETTEQYYDEKKQTFLADRYIVGMCARCGHQKAFADQCDNCGIPLHYEELFLPRSVLSGETPIRKATTNWHLPLYKYERWLQEWVNKCAKKGWKANVVGQCQSWLDTGLRSRAMTRDLDWGIPVPNEKGKVLYVWFEAPIGYMSATRALFEELATGTRKYSTPQRDFGKVKKEDWKSYWQKGSKLIHFIGKDNIVFHCLIFPLMLDSMMEYALPENVPANEFMNLEGDKMSTNLGWSIEMDEYLEAFPGKADSLRYFILNRLPENKDSEFTWKWFKNKHNNELGAILGNFIHRTMVLIDLHFKGEIPPRDKLNEGDKKMVSELRKVPANIGEAIEKYRFKEAVTLFMGMARLGNKYLTDNEPWKVAKTDLQRAGTVLSLAAQITANLAVMADPFLPFTAKQLLDMLNMEQPQWPKTGQINLLKKGHKLNKPAILFEPIEKSKIEEQVERLKDKRLCKLKRTYTSSLL